ncbi:MAG TPA: macro domain-containing protein [Deltaproteobacteria bacterium]|nr:macro domain-containing protein [Deltaproteobacteria bacterium]HPR56122.1 macro domain-containing protein [Deltaproteobacteria bacterium]HXK48214.1 macro domain-containing protein [Deltaproteobacteria bacterium]
MEMKEIPVRKSRLQFVVGDITAQDTEAVVNAANSRLAPGGGVAGAIHRAAGPGLWEECRGLGGCETGEAKISGGHDLPNRYVIHTVGPVYRGSKEDAVLLRSCYVNSLKLADRNKVSSIAFPALSTGIFGYPTDKAAYVAIKAILEYLGGETGIDVVRMVLYDDVSYREHLRALDAINAGVDLS